MLSDNNFPAESSVYDVLVRHAPLIAHGRLALSRDTLEFRRVDEPSEALGKS